MESLTDRALEDGERAGRKVKAGMLQAIGKNKARGFLLGGRHRRPTEDIVTDCVTAEEQ
jgi:hypothetical protein